MPLYQTNDYTPLQIKEKKYIGKVKPKLNKTWNIHTLTNENRHIYISIYH